MIVHTLRRGERRYLLNEVASGTSVITPLSGAVDYWKFQGNSTDSAGSLNGTDSGSPTYSTGNGKIGQGVGFNGSTQYISLGTSKLNYTVMTIAFWLVNKGTNKTAYILCRAPNADVWGRLGIAMVGGYLYLATNISSAVNKRVLPYSTVTNGDHFVFLLKSDGTAQVYRNGSLVTPTDALTGFDAWNNNITDSLSIGRAGGFNNYYFDGALDELGVWNRLLSTTEIALLYADGGTGTTYPF